MCQRNWRQYNASLVQRGSLTFFCDPKVVRALKKAKAPRKGAGRPAYPPQLILMLLLLKLTYKLTYRACEGMAHHLFTPHGIQVPSYSTLCRRMRDFVSTLPSLSKRRPQIVLLDSSGFKVQGEGEWKTKVHGKARRRSWVKVHLVVDSRSNEIVDVITTPSNVSDAEMGIALLERMPRSARSLYADGAYDGEGFRRLSARKGIVAVVPPPQHAILRVEGHLAYRNDALRIIKGLGDDLLARRLWGKLTGYCHRVKVESAFARLKKVFGERLFSRRFDALVVEVWMKALLSNIWIKWAS
ncbi:MAG: IS5 family transposase [Chlamydiia bacterium]|nr:IS5 family transposase [Chlamydiia bacterium]